MTSLKLFDELNNMNKFYDNFLDSPFLRGSMVREQAYPALDISKNEEEYLVKAQLPGYAESDINIDMNNGVLTISGKQEVEKSENYNKEYSEYKQITNFERKVKIPNVIDQEKVEAKLNHGILTIRMPIAETSKPKQIEVKAG